jgi:hypothetical protein
VRLEAVPPVPPCVNVVSSVSVRQTESRREPPLNDRTEVFEDNGMESRSLNQSSCGPPQKPD